MGNKMSATAPPLGSGILSPPPAPILSESLPFSRPGAWSPERGSHSSASPTARAQHPSPPPQIQGPGVLPSSHTSSLSNLPVGRPTASGLGPVLRATGMGRGWVGLGLQDPSALWPQVPLPDGGWSGLGGREAGGRPDKPHSFRGWAGGHSQSQPHSQIHARLVAAARARTHTRARPATASWGCGWPLGGDGPACLRLAPPHPSRPARRSPQRALPS